MGTGFSGLFVQPLSHPGPPREECSITRARAIAILILQGDALVRIAFGALHQCHHDFSLTLARTQSRYATALLEEAPRLFVNICYTIDEVSIFGA